MRSRSRSVMDLTMTARAPGTVISTSRFHLGTRWGGQRIDACALEARHVRGGGGDEGLAGAHLADHGGAPVGFEGEGRALDGVLLRPQGLAEQPGSLCPFSEGR